MNKALKAPNEPDVSIGKIYLIINGMNVLNNPEHSPWINLQIKNKTKFGIKVKESAIKAITVVIRRDYLC